MGYGISWAAVPGERSVCTTSHTIADNGSTLGVIPGECVTATDSAITEPGPTTTVATTETVHDTTTVVSTQTVTVAPPPPPPPPPQVCTTTLAAGSSIPLFYNTAAPGSTICLASGSYAGNFSLTSSGVTLTAVQGASPAINGFIEITNSANDDTISNVLVNGASSTQNTFQIWGDRFKLLNSEINGGHSSTTQDCIFIGHPTYGVAYDTVIDHNRIHDCGSSGHGHGLYVKDTRGVTKITNNYIYDNTNFGIQFYDDGDSVDFSHNVVDGSMTNAGVIFAGESSSASDNDHVSYNIITNNKTYGITSYWGSFGVGVGNSADHNCLFGNASGPYGSQAGWVNNGGNVLADPRYVNRVAKDFRLQPGSPCAAMGPQ